MSVSGRCASGMEENSGIGFYSVLFNLVCVRIVGLLVIPTGVHYALQLQK